LVTVKLKDSEKINNGDKLILQVKENSIELEDSENQEITDTSFPLYNNSKVSVYATTVLLDKGELTITLKSDADTDDNLENTVLAGSSNVTIAELDIEAEYENIKVKELVFTTSGSTIDFSNTLKNVRLINIADNSVIADGAIITSTTTGDDIKTKITFKNDFIIANSSNKIEAELVADLNSITGRGNETSAKAGSIKITNIDAIESDIRGVQSNDNIGTVAVEEVDAESISIVPTILRFALKQSLNDGSAKIEIIADSGENTVGSSDDQPEVTLTKLTFAELGSADEYKLYKE
jgi:hypothetical protein